MILITFFCVAHIHIDLVKFLLKHVFLSMCYNKDIK